jgi:phospholipase/carboxylesterase
MRGSMTMSTHSDLSLNYVLNVPTGKADSEAMPLVVLLHGRGADANDLAGLAPHLDGPGGYRFILPNAPRPFEPMLPMPGMAFGFTWFDGWPPVRGSVDASRQLLLRFLNEVAARYPVDGDRIVLAGFSQGALMSLDCGFRTASPLRGVVVMSGGLYEEEAPDFDARRGQRVLIVHGTEDEVVPVIAARRMRAVLEEHGLQPEYHELPMGHSVTEESMAIVARFLVGVIGDQSVIGDR